MSAPQTAHVDAEARAEAVARITDVPHAGGAPRSDHAAAAASSDGGGAPLSLASTGRAGPAPPPASPAGAESWPYVMVVWSPPSEDDEDDGPVYRDAVHHLIVPRHLVTPERRALLTKTRLREEEIKAIEQLLSREWADYVVPDGEGPASIYTATRHVCPCEQQRACPGHYESVRYCEACCEESGRERYGEVSEELEAKIGSATCTRHPRCWCRDDNESFSDPAQRKPCAHCRYVPAPRPPKPPKRTKRARAASTSTAGSSKAHVRKADVTRNALPPGGHTASDAPDTSC